MDSGMKRHRHHSDTASPHRRRFLVSGGAIVSAFGFSCHGWPASGDDRIRLGVIGVGVRGKFLIANLPPEFQVVALCDFSTRQIDSAREPKGRFAKILKTFAATDGQTCKTHQDYRTMLGKQPLDAVIIATPDHHHAQAAILAMQSGADVYLEKPISVAIGEGRAIADAAAKYGRVVQVGSQQRTMEINRRACEFIRDGGLGSISLIQARNLPGPMPYDPDEFPAQPIPASLKWNLFCGPTPRRPYHERLWVKDAFKFGYMTWRGWDLLEDYSGHLMTNWGAHSVDMVQYALGMDDSGPIQIGLRPDQVDQYTDDQWHEKTPPLGSVRDKQRDQMRFCPVTVQYENGTRLQFEPGITKTVFHGEKGRLYLSRNNYRTEPAGLLAAPKASEKLRWKGDGYVARPHLENWLTAIRDRSALNAPIEVGHRSITVCHLANIARRLGRPLRWDPRAEQFVDDPQANQHLSRPRREGFTLPDLS